MYHDLKSFIEGIDNLKKQNPADLSADQDLSIGIMNLIAIEEHLFFSGAKTEKQKFYDMIEPVRQIRKEMMQKIIKQYEGEVWCISKHLLSASMRLMEVGTKQQSVGNKQEATNLFNNAYNLYCMFWALNANTGAVSTSSQDSSLDTASIVELAQSTIENSKISEKNNVSDTESHNMFTRFKKVVSKALDCCRE